jgi:hypothetical protein
MKTYAIRFLKQGLIEIEVPDSYFTDDIIAKGKETLDEMSDQDLVMAMRDCIPSGKYPSMFDKGSFQVEAVEDADEEYELIYSTNLWQEYLNE